MRAYMIYKSLLEKDACLWLGLTALHLATQLGRRDAVEVLLSAGASVNSIDGKNGRTALYYAAELDHIDVATALIDGGARVDMPSYSGCLPAQAAMARSHDRMVALLENAGMTTLTNLTSVLR